MFNDKLDEPPKLVFTFDDGDSSIYDVAFQLMIDYGFRGTNFINSETMGLPNKMTWEQIREMELLYSWETGCHTLKHENLTHMSLDEAIANIEEDKHNLEEQGLCPVSFALPKGQAPNNLYPTLQDLFQNVRGSSDFAMYHPLTRFALGYLPYQSNWDADLIKARILRGIANNEDLIIIGFHRFNSVEDIYHDSCTTETFREILDFVQSRNLEVIPLRCAF
ncbi:MAG: hypothetical protein PWP64_1055 [Candidatus Cloacimonadota bacterium]|nr:hypothetical protein [Candidatus Cloacimonadota bacterium]